MQTVLEIWPEGHSEEPLQPMPEPAPSVRPPLTAPWGASGCLPGWEAGLLLGMRPTCLNSSPLAPGATVSADSVPEPQRPSAVRAPSRLSERTPHCVSWGGGASGSFRTERLCQVALRCMCPALCP